ncbi:MAG TPA: hypothetical protein VI072_06695 [Polyangiaceae bacterium]
MRSLKLGTLAACLIATLGACGGDVTDSRDQPSRTEDEDSRNREESKRDRRKYTERWDAGASSAGGSGGASCEPPRDAGASGGGGLTGGGGLGGGGGSSGGKSCTSPDVCEGCGFAGPFGCCKADGKCGCSWAPSYCF